MYGSPTVLKASRSPSLPEDAGYDFSVTKDPILAISLEEVQENFRRYDLLDGKVKFLKGWFRDTLHVAPIRELAILRLDGDLYESTMDALNALYHKVSPGGFIIVDDFNDFEPCFRAVIDFARSTTSMIQSRILIGLARFGASHRKCNQVENAGHHRSTAHHRRVTVWRHVAIDSREVMQLKPVDVPSPGRGHPAIRRSHRAPDGFC